MLRRTRVTTKELVPMFEALLTPAAAMSAVLALWRLGADLQWTEEFAISRGLFSHWQVWMGIAAALQYLKNHAQRGRRI